MMAGPAAPARFYAVRKPVAAFMAGAAIALLAGLIGLGGAEFRLPVLIMVFALYAHRAVRINLLISLATLLAASVVRLQLVPEAGLSRFSGEIVAMALAGMAAAWSGAGMLARIPRQRMQPLVAVLLGGIALLLVAEGLWDGSSGPSPASGVASIALALVIGIAVGAISSLLGVAGGEFIIPALVLVFGLDIRTAGTASVLVSLPIVLAGVLRHLLDGKFRSTTMLGHLVLPMSLGSVIGALAGGYASAAVAQDGLRAVLAAVLLASAWKLWRASGAK
jgi:uncharacterized membrane protein YfcA